jgi:hypothetical protein
LEEQMPDPIPPPAPSPAGPATPQAPSEDEAIRERARLLTAQVLQQGRLDPEGMRELVRALTGGVSSAASETTPAASAPATPAAAPDRQEFAEQIRRLNGALAQSAVAANVTLERLAARGADFSDNDLKDAVVALRRMEQDYVALATRLTTATSTTLRRELGDLAASAQSLGADATSRVAGFMGELANRMGDTAASGVRTARSAGVGVAQLASGVFAGVADALRERSERKPDKTG